MNSTRIFLICLAMFLLLFIGAVFIFFNTSLTKHMDKIVETGLNERIKPNVVLFKAQMNEQIKKMNTIADFLTVNDDFEEVEYQKILHSLVKNNDLLRCVITFPNGDFITHDGKTDNKKKGEFIRRAMNGEINITDSIHLEGNETKSVIVVTVPIIKNEEIIGTLSYYYLSDTIGIIFNLDYLDTNAQMFIIKQNGQIIMGNTLDFNGEKNIINYLNSNNNQHITYKGIIKKEGFFLHSIGDKNEQFYSHYYHLDINDWYLYSIIPVEAATETIRAISKEQQMLVLIVSGLVLFYILTVIFFWGLRQTNTDNLTGAPTFENFKRQATKIIKKNPRQRFLMIKFDVKNFKLINRLYSFAEGDRFIKNIATALKETLPENTTFARLNTDNFVLLFPFTSQFYVDKSRENFLNRFKELMGDKFKAIVRLPSGQCLITEEDAIKPNIVEIFEKANFAHQHARKLGGNAIVDHDEVLEREALFQKIIEDKMEDALEKGEFALFLQPKYLVSDETICGAESLVRWLVDDMFIFNTCDFVPIFEKNGFIIKIDMYMFELTVKKIKEMIDQGLTPVPFSTNFSRFHLNNENFVDELCSITDKYNVPHKYLEIELTESVVFDNISMIIKLLDDLHKNGFTLAMDDFGSGYSSLGLLKNLEIDVMKIDQTFFQNNLDEKRANIVIKNIINLAHNLGAITVAEGVETKSQMQMLRNFDCDVIQGFYYAKPMKADKFIKVYTNTE